MEISQNISNENNVNVDFEIGTYEKYTRSITHTTIHGYIGKNNFRVIKINYNIFEHVNPEHIKLIFPYFGSQYTQIKLYNTDKGIYLQPTEKIEKIEFEDLFFLGWECSGYNDNIVVFIPK